MSDEFGAKLSRWSQRKAAARRGALPKETAPEPQRDEPAAEPSASEEKPAEDLAKLPPVEELTAESDFTVFLRENVPEAIKRAALRKLWGSDPVLANLDGLNDYDEDYNLANSVVGAVRTAYRVGKGYVDEAEEKPAQEKARDSGEPAESAATAPVVAANENKIEPPVDDANTATQEVGAGEDGEVAAGPAPDKAV